MIAVESTPPPPVWQWPLQHHRVLLAFRAPVSAFGPGHRGLDLAAEPGSEVRAVANGVVRFVGEIAGVPVVSIDHGRIRSTYQPVSASVRIGDRVTVGTPLGAVTSTGGHCLSPCLHLGARIGDDYVDPLELLTPRRAVLKPL